ncbi:MAG: hypothetical protein ABWZ38_02250 [Candidatus Binatia bacterium]
MPYVLRYNRCMGQATPNADAGVKAEEQVEKLVAEISRVIRAAEPEKRAGLKELAETLLHEEVSTLNEEPRQVEDASSRSSANPLAAGILLGILGLGLLLIIPLVGATLAVIGLILAIWGGIISWSKK